MFILNHNKINYHLLVVETALLLLIIIIIKYTWSSGIDSLEYGVFIIGIF
jgi:hypothetical protein